MSNKWEGDDRLCVTLRGELKDKIQDLAKEHDMCAAAISRRLLLVGMQHIGQDDFDTRIQTLEKLALGKAVTIRDN